MATLTACPACRTAVPPGGRTCLRCGHTVDEPVRPCPTCRQPAGGDAHYCARCGSTLDTTAPADIPTPDLTGVFPEPRSYRRPLLVGVSVLGALVLALTAVDVVAWGFFRPQATLTAYFEALADRDAARAGRLLAAGEGEMPDPATLKSKDYTPPSDVRIGDVETGEDSATAQVSFVLGGERHETTMTLVRDADRTAGLFDRWRVADGTHPISVYVSGVQSVMLAGASLPILEGGGDARAWVFPGDYVARLPEQPLLTAAPVTVRAGVGTGLGGRTVTAEIVPAVAPGAREEVQRQVDSYLAQCAASTRLDPEGCPFASQDWVFGEVSGVRWKIVSPPAIEVGLSPYGAAVVGVETVESGLAEVTWQETYLGASESESEEVAFSVEGTVAVSGSTLIFQPS